MGAFVFGVLSLAGNILTLLFVVAAVVSFLPTPSRFSPLYGILRAINRITEPILRPIRRWLPDFGGLDLSPLVAIVGIWVVLQILRNLLLV